MSLFSTTRKCLNLFLGGVLRQKFVRNIGTSIHWKNSMKGISRSLKSHSCGKLRASDVGKRVRLRGFIQYHRMLQFVVIRDAFGKIQVVFDKSDQELMKFVKDTSYESYIEVFGTVRLRPEGQINKKMETGEIEIVAEKINLLNPIKSALPFLIRDQNTPGETLALTHQYLNLRHTNVQQRLRFRSNVAKKMRDYLQEVEDFVEVTTPTLSAHTEGGAHEFVVPSRTPGHFYSLVQSPQLYKQLLMAGGMEKYFQFATCYRDEIGTSDRQPEFTQLDIEMADTTGPEVMQLLENIIHYSWGADLPSIAESFPRMSYDEAMDNYGTDKPDIRFDSKIIDIKDILQKVNHDFLHKLLKEPDCCCRAIVIPDGKIRLPNKVAAKFEDEAKSMGLDGAATLHVTQDSKLKGPFVKEFTEDVTLELISRLTLKPDDLIVFTMGPSPLCLKFLGNIRLNAAEMLESAGVKVRGEERDLKFLWIVDFPLFEEAKDSEGGGLVSCHHPFTQPREEDLHLLYTDPLKARSQAYDLVLNGCEIAGGSIRIHDCQMQAYVLKDILKIDAYRFKFLLSGLAYGAPPHGGIALGFDRYLSILGNCNSIRDVIAFPKSREGKCYLTGAPSKIAEITRQKYNLNDISKDS